MLVKGTWRVFRVHLPHRVSGGCCCNCSPIRLLQEMGSGDVRTGVCFLCVLSPSFSLLLRYILTPNCVFPSSCHHPTRDPTVQGSLWPPAVCALEIKNLPSALAFCWDRDSRLLGFAWVCIHSILLVGSCLGQGQASRALRIPLRDQAVCECTPQQLPYMVSEARRLW